jgi:hypothetical protein
LKNPLKTLRSEFPAGLLEISFRLGMKKNFRMSKSNSDDDDAVDDLVDDSVSGIGLNFNFRRSKLNQGQT